MIVILEIIVYVAFGFLCLHWILSGVKKIKEIRSEQAYEASEKESLIPSTDEDASSETEKEDKSDN